MKTGRTLAIWGSAGLLAVTGLLSACSDNSSSTDAPPATSSVPVEASNSVAGFTDYLQRLVVASADMLEPVDTSAVTPPTDDTVEPRQID